MALIHIDGFDHYGTDTTRMTEGVYDQVDAAFTLSEVNPRTGARCLRRDSSPVDDRVIKNFESTKEVVGFGSAVNLSSLPSNNYSYAIASLIDSIGSDQITFAINSDGSVRVLLGDVNGAEVASSDLGAVEAGSFVHFEAAVKADTSEGSVPDISGLLGLIVESLCVSELSVYTGFDETEKLDWESKYGDTSEIGVFDYVRYSSSQSVSIPKQTKTLPFYTGWTLSLEANIDNTSNGADTFLKLGFTRNGSVVFVMIMDQLSIQKLRIRFGANESNLTTATTTVGTSGTTNVNATITFTDSSINFNNNGTTGFHGYVQDWNFNAPFIFVDSIVAESGPTSITVAPNQAGNIGHVLEIKDSDFSEIFENPNGILEVRVNGVTVISGSSIKTVSSADKNYSGLTLNLGSGNQHDVATDLDDLFIWDDSGAWNNSFLGDRRCLLMKPNQDTNIADFDPSSGSFGYKVIDDDSPDDDSTYIIAEAYLQSGSPLSGTSEFEIEDLPDGTSLISAVNVVTRASKTDSTSAEVFTSINSGVNSLSEDAHTLTTSYQYFNDIFEFDPTTIASLTKDGFNALTVSVTASDLDSGESLGGSPPAESPSEEAPDAPSSLVAARDGGYSAAFITWVDNSDDETSFELQYDTDVGFGSPTTVNPAANATIHRVSGLTRGQTYYFRIRAVNASGNSDWSNTDDATIFQLSDVTLYAEYDANAGVFQDSGTTPVASDGDPVGQVQDQTGNGRHITQTTASAKPVWKTNQLNSLPVIRNDVGDFLKAATAADWKFMHDGTEFAAFVVWKTTNTDPDAGYVLLDTGGLSSATIGFASFWDNRSSQPRVDQHVLFIAKGTAGTFHSNPVTAVNTVTSNSWHIHSARFTATNLENFHDGEFSKSATAGKTGTASSSNPEVPLTVGARGINNTLNLVGDWARILIVNGSLSDANHKAIQDYLSETYEPFRTRFFGTASVVQHDTSGLDHNGFVGLGLSDNGNLVLGYSKNSNHTSQDGKLVYRISSDRGATWGSEITLWDYAVEGGGTDLWFTPRFTTLADGRMLMAVGLRTSQAPVVDGIGYFESSDNGQTWSGPTQLTAATFTAWSAEGGGIIELANGNLLYPYYGRDTGDAANRRSCAVLRSTDGGTTWSALAVIGDGTVDGKDYTEPGIFQADNGDIVAMIREDVVKDMYVSRSTDGGATWSTPSLELPDVTGLMAPLKLSSGAVIAPQRAELLSGDPTQLVFSQNNGTTWQKGIDFAGSPNFTQGQMTYGQFVEDSNGIIYLAYGSENNVGGGPVSDVMFVKAD